MAVATVLFPRMSLLAARGDLNGLRASCDRGTRLILLVLLPAMAALLVLSEPVTRLVYERGEFGTASTTLVSTALFWFALSLPLSGINLLLTRTLFSLQRPWLVARLAVLNLAVNVGASVAFLDVGIGGIVAGTAVADLVLAVAQVVVLRRLLGAAAEAQVLSRALVAMLVAATGFAVVARVAWNVADGVVGRGLVGGDLPRDGARCRRAGVLRRGPRAPGSRGAAAAPDDRVCRGRRSVTVHAVMRRGGHPLRPDEGGYFARVTRRMAPSAVRSE